MSSNSSFSLNNCSSHFFFQFFNFYSKIILTTYNKKCCNKYFLYNYNIYRICLLTLNKL